ncbi:hypothetical protein FOZ62_008492 [Perkinsus olseni]|uniref:ZZ-type domain-containing protein n=1 Tax=Perkinsus olseni TaxID=32597 RepID=A0A7J6S4S5_PEROL|nr:hypothetical protein FOZ62_008492 [Perkinsus olseni]
MSAENLVVKVGYEGSIWRLKVPTQEVSYEKVKEVVEKMVPPEKGRMIRYKDDEGDMCVLTPETFEDAIDISHRSNGLIRLDVVNMRQLEPLHMPMHSALDEYTAMHCHSTLPPSKSPSTNSLIMHSPQHSGTGIETSKQDKDAAAAAFISSTRGSFEQHPSHVSSPGQPHAYSGPLNSASATPQPLAGGIEKASVDDARTHAQSCSVVQPQLSKPSDKIYTPKPVLRMFLCLNDMNLLTPRMITSSMLLAITHIPVLHEFMPLLQAIVNSGPNTPEVTEFGQWFVGLLKIFSTLTFDAQVQDEYLREFESVLDCVVSKQGVESHKANIFVVLFVSFSEVLLMVTPSWIPCFQTAVGLGHFDVPPTPKQQVTHHGVDCDGCGSKPIVGPRFKCQVCDYDLCGECYPNKSNLHAELHDFVCVLRPGREVSGAASKDPHLSELSAPALSAYVSSLESRVPWKQFHHHQPQQPPSCLKGVVGEGGLTVTEKSPVSAARQPAAAVNSGSSSPFVLPSPGSGGAGNPYRS